VSFCVRHVSALSGGLGVLPHNPVRRAIDRHPAHGADVLVDLDGLTVGAEIHRELVVELSVLGTDGEELVENLARKTSISMLTECC